MSKTYKSKIKVKGWRAVFVIQYVKDFAPRRAAEAAGRPPENGHTILQEPDIQAAIKLILEDRLEEAGVDPEWILYELADNHRIARQQGNIPASTNALKALMVHVSVDAMAKQKIVVDDVTEKNLLERLLRGRKRMNGEEEEPSFL